MSEQNSMLRQAVTRAHNGLKMLLGRGRIKLVLDNDQGPVQMVQAVISAKETMDLPRVAEFGFASRPPKDTDCVVVFLNAERTWGVVVGTNNQTFRFKLENDGEMAIHDAFGKYIWLKKTGGILIEANDQPVEIHGAKGLTITTSDDVTINMGGKNLTIDSPGAVALTGTGGRKVVCDGDPVSGGVVHAAGGQKVTAT